MSLDLDKTQGAQPSRPAGGIRSVNRCLGVLFAFSRKGTHTLTLSEIAARTDLDPSTALRYARTLCDAKLLLHNSDGSYSLGFALLQLANATLAQFDVRDRARPTMLRIRDEVDESVLLAVRREWSRYYIEIAEGFHEFRRTGGVGEPGPLHVGAPGRVLLAYLDDDGIDNYLGSLGALPNGDDGRDLVDLRKQLQRVRQDGYCETINDAGRGGAGVAAPIFNHGGDVVAALSVAAIVPRWQQIREHAHALVTEGAAEISRAMGLGQDEPAST